MSKARLLRFVPAVAVLGAVTLVDLRSEAHFSLQTPPAMYEQNGLGDPQKAPPCGDNGSAVPTGAITTFQQDQTITITINETICHPGHYRVALAVNDPSELPEEPPVTAAPPYDCGSAPIDDTPEFPVLADGLFVHDCASAPGTQTFEVTLPDDVTCDHCTLQIIQFMSEHDLNNPGGCYYHHCAEIALQEEPVMTTTTTTTTGSSMGGGSANGGSGGNAGGAGGDDNQGTPPGFTSPSDDGCSCSVPGSSNGPAAAFALFGLAGLGVLAARRRRSS
jgi:MYXO-CTERM domain-containing protein